MRRLRVVTWNVGRLYTPRTTIGSTTPTCRRWRASLCELDPDVVLLQELVDVRQLAAIRGALRHERGRTRARSPSAAAMIGTCCGAGAARARARCSSSSAWARPRARDARVLRCRGRAARRAPVGALRRVRSRAPADPGRVAGGAHRRRATRHRCVVGGDFNLDPALGGGGRRRRRRTPSRCWLAPSPTAARRRGRRCMGLLRVDHLFVAAAASRAFRACLARRRLPLGDHDPLVCDVDLG